MFLVLKLTRIWRIEEITPPDIHASVTGVVYYPLPSIDCVNQSRFCCDVTHLSALDFNCPHVSRKQWRQLRAPFLKVEAVVSVRYQQRFISRSGGLVGDNLFDHQLRFTIRPNGQTSYCQISDAVVVEVSQPI